MMIMAIDPGTEKSAYVLLEEKMRPLAFGILSNEAMLIMIKLECCRIDRFAIETIASYGMSVGQEVFDTCVWIGRFIQIAHENNIPVTKIKRLEVKNHLCHTSKANDSNIRQVLIDRFGVVGTKRYPGWFHGVSKDIWSAIAVGVVAADRAQEALDVKKL